MQLELTRWSDLAAGLFCTCVVSIHLLESGGSSVSRKSRVLAVLLCGLLIMSVTVTGCGKKQEVVKETAVSVSMEKAKIHNIAMSQTYSGTVRGENEVMILPKVPARVTAIYVKPGDMVRQGQTLMTLDNKDFQAAIRQAQAGLQAAQAGKRANEIQVQTAKNAYERIQKLHDAGAASDVELENARAAYEALTAGSAEAMVAQAQAGLASAQEAMNNCVITSPISGVVGSVNVSLGDTANPQSPTAVVTTTEQLELSIMVPEADITYIKTGSQVKVSVRAAGEEDLPGTVKTIATVADPMKRNFEVKIALKNPGGKIKSGMFAEVGLDTQSKSNVLVVPISAVIPRTGSNIVYTVDKNKRARSIEVETGIKNKHYIEITKGLKEGQSIISKGNTLVSEGTLVRVISGGAK